MRIGFLRRAALYGRLLSNLLMFAVGVAVLSVLYCLDGVFLTAFFCLDGAFKIIRLFIGCCAVITG